MGPARSDPPTAALARSSTRRAALVGVLALITVASLALSARNPTWVLADQGHDDALFAGLAGHLVDGQWLGPYQSLTLAKGPTYPMFIAAAYELHLPLTLAEQSLHLVAAAVVALAAWRLTRSSWLAAGAYAVIALDPTHLGTWGNRVSREAVYGALSLILVYGTILFLGLLPGLLARGLRWTVPVMAVAGAALGVTGAAYYMCRDERAWVAPAVALAAGAGAATWRLRDRDWLRPALAAAAALVVAAGSFAASVHRVTARNRTHYGAAVISDLVDGEIARAYTEWQRVDVGEHRRFVPVSRRQRSAVYAVSPAAAEMAPWLDGPPGERWLSFGCDYGVCDDMPGTHFVWAMRAAAADRGHMDSAGEAQRYFGEIADDIASACRSELPCDAPGIGPMPPLSRVSARDVAASAWRASGYFLALEFASPARPWPSSGSQEQWTTMVRSLRGIDDDQAAYLARERGAEDDQWPITALAWLYRWCGRVGGALATAGLAAGALTRAGRRHGAVALAVAATLAAVLARIAFVALIDASAYPAAESGVYLLPAAGFYGVFVILGTWLAVTVVRERRLAVPDEDENLGVSGGDELVEPIASGPRSTAPDPSTVTAPSHGVSVGAGRPPGRSRRPEPRQR